MILNASVSGEGKPLVLLHGLFGAARNLGVLSRALARQARVIALDLRNHGESPHGAAMDYPTLAADVAETLAAMGIARADVAGHSMGGKTAMALALARPEMVARLAVLDVAPIPYHHDYGDYVRAMQAIDLRPGLTRAAAEQALAPTVKAAPMRAFLLNNLVLGEHPRWRVGLAEIAAAMPEILGWADPPGAKPFTGPALFLSGAESDYVGPEAEAPIRRLFPNAVLRRVAGAAHWLHADKPAEVIASLQEFFAP
jgi:pimeloyl-ACP methyl ester carboxylesterase